MSAKKTVASAEKGANSKPELTPEEQFSVLSPDEQSLALYTELKALRTEFRGHQHGKDGGVELHASANSEVDRGTPDLQGDPPPVPVPADESALDASQSGQGGEESGGK